MVEARSVILTDLFSDKFLLPPSDSSPNELQHFSSKEEKILMGKAHRESQWRKAQLVFVHFSRGNCLDYVDSSSVHR
jgi:hypothetical protein